MYAVSFLMPNGVSDSRTFEQLDAAEGAYRELIRDGVTLVVMIGFGRVIHQDFGGPIGD